MPTKSRFNPGGPLTGAACILSPYGTYDDATACNAASMCGALWRCASVGGTVDVVSGETVQAGNPVRVNDGSGVYANASDCLCYMCDGTEGVGTCMPTDGTQGDGPSATDCGACGWGWRCDATTGAKVWDQTGTIPNEADVHCFRCGTGDVCEIAPAGDGDPGYTSLADCGAATDTTNMCGWGYQCGAGGVCEKAFSGTFEEGACTCYECKTTGTNTGSCGFVDPGVTTGTTLANCECNWGCSADGLTKVRNSDGVVYDDVKCWKCSADGGGPGTSCDVDLLGKGDYFTGTECDTDTTVQCGWGYGCVDDVCAISSSAPRGQTEDECRFDGDVQCGWGYGCFEHFACAGDTCVGVDASYSGTKYNSLQECINDANECSKGGDEQGGDESCNPMQGEWYLTRSVTNVPLFRTATGNYDSVTFTEGTEDAEGYTWFMSNELDNTDTPVIEVAIKQDVGTGEVFMKARGRVWWGVGSDINAVLNADSYEDWWNGINVSNATYESPAASVIATGVTSCFTLDYIDLGDMCGTDNQCIKRDSGSISVLMLQRKEYICGVGGHALADGAFGTLFTACKCSPNAECCPAGGQLQMNGLCAASCHAASSVTDNAFQIASLTAGSYAITNVTLISASDTVVIWAGDWNDYRAIFVFTEVENGLNVRMALYIDFDEDTVSDATHFIEGGRVNADGTVCTPLDYYEWYRGGIYSKDVLSF